MSQRSICNLPNGVTTKVSAWKEMMPPSSIEPSKPLRDGSTTEIAGEGEAKTFHVSSGVDPGPSSFDWPHD
ncbi:MULTISPECIES: hypothetical protein [unclassified Bradyrhizobium]|uniref:hypothetical protein n=1 Tax=unclassified Bradyrhizobium TaxID=2631580 RepID=UPI00102E769C|nr:MULTISPECIES: hypothetical protein [unclassified Bradyrhizobium]MDI4231383.1 hypothetical protein [Bradyrhizobium sp. Arg237L]TAI67839.1 hypothetical protein CWO89_00505 [Bradyrhizobium sp. Leo170]